MLLGFSIILFSNYTGKASYYTIKDNKLNGHNMTASGEVFNEDAFTCASNRHKFNTLLRVTNLKNNKSIICRVNDRGGFHKYNRVIDLSKKSFKSIAPLKNGVIRVKVTVIK